MHRVAEIVAWLEGFAPSSLAETWDNVGLLWGDPSGPADRVMTCLTVTPETAAEAIEAGAGLIVSHHPVLFRGAKQIRADRGDGAYLWALARAGVAVASPHTAFDNTEGGINDGLARRLGLIEVGPLRATPAPPEFKIVVFTPKSDRASVLDAAFAAGAGRIGNYEECSYSGPGVGTFHGQDGSNPTVGQPGRRESAREWRVELICPEARLRPVLAAIWAAHSYEEPAIDVYPLKPLANGPGAGRVGDLAEPMPLDAFARGVARALGIESIQCVGPPGHSVRRVAIVCGAGDDFVPDAARAKADVLVTGEARYHRGLEALQHPLGLVVAGHHATERPGVEELAERIGRAFPAADVWASRREADPFRVLGRADPK